MKTSDRTILIGVGVLALIGAFIVLVLMPKRNEASKLGDQVSQTRSTAEQAEQQVAFASAAQRSFPANYGRLVSLGKAVPADDDTSSLLVELSGIAKRTGVDFRGIELGQSTQSAPAPAPPAAATGGGSSDAKTQNASTTASTTPAAATEASAASLPIGASVGSAGLPVMPYKLSFVGNFSKISKFIDGVQKLVDPKTGQVKVSGRLITIDGFSLSRDEKAGFPMLKASFLVTTYVTPQSQGLTAGATASGPAAAPAGSPSTTTVSNSTGGPTP
jgi:Tfp pilus assembly protein PilO